MDEKEFRKISREQVKQVFEVLFSGEREKSELDKLIVEKSENLSEALETLFPWGFFYELSESYMAALFLLSVTSKERIQEFKSSKDPNQELIDWAQSEVEPEGWLVLDDKEDLAFLLSLTMAYNFNLQAHKMGKPSINTLITRVREGDKDALFDAVLIDRMVLSCPSVGKLIGKATVENDENFFILLSKAITKTRPKKKPDPKYNNLRFGLGLLDQAKGLENITYDDLYNVLVEDMNLYPYTDSDTFRGFERFVQRLKEKQAT